jgi:hypothetical protein
MNNQNVATTLVFPGGMSKSLEYVRSRKGDGGRIIGASSLVSDPASGQYDEWLFLPFITDPRFKLQLRKLLTHYAVTGIYTPNIVIWNHLKGLLSEMGTEVALVNTSPADADMSSYRKALKHANALLLNPIPLASDTPCQDSISYKELASLFRDADLIPGMCDDEKTVALCEILRRSPPGDIVEIGSWWGKSAYILARLAKYYGIGKLLCVDPWSSGDLIQNEDSGIVDTVVANLDVDEALTVFELNLLNANDGCVNYLRMTSVHGSEHYRSGAPVVTPSFGTTTYAGQISVLHIDGNHSFDAVKADVKAWTGYVIPGGWIIFDDYDWAYGDGPKLNADEFIRSNLNRVAVAFVMGGALFIQISALINF